MGNLNNTNLVFIILAILSAILTVFVFVFQNLISFSRDLDKKRRIFKIAIVFILFIFIGAAYFSGVRIKFYNIDQTNVKGVETEKRSDVAFMSTLLNKTPPEECNEQLYCSDFTDSDNWTGWERFYKSPDNPREFLAVPSKVFDTPHLWYQKIEIGPEFSLKLKTTPKNDSKANIVISYGDKWRCIIGEASYNAITCEELLPNKRRYSKYLTSEGYKPIKPKTQISLENLITLINGNGDLNLSFKLAYISDNESAITADIPFTIKLPSAKPQEMKEYIGIGLIDPKDEGIKAEFQFFNLKPL